MTVKSFLLLVLLLFCTGTLGLDVLEPSNTELLVKSITLGGNHDLTVAEFRFDFDEDLYAQQPSSCAGGLCAHTAETHANDPCFPIACDFTLKGADCGKAAHPSCEDLCAAQRGALCPEIQDWVVLEVDVESPLFSLSDLINTDLEFRFNWDKICQPMMLEVISLIGENYARISATAVAFDLSSPELCAYSTVPASHAILCPSNQHCYKYGTYFGFLTSYHIDGQASVIVRSLPIENISSPHAYPPADSPPSFYDPVGNFLDSLNIPVYLGVPLFFTLSAQLPYLPFVRDG